MPASRFKAPSPLTRLVMGTVLALAGACSAQHTTARAPQAAQAKATATQSGSAATVVAAAPAKAAKAHFAIIGDFGQSGMPEQQVADLVHSWQPEFIVTLGDNNYPNGEESTLEANIGQYYGDYIRLKRARDNSHATSDVQRFFPCLGNHDWRAEGALPYLNYFDLPGNGRYYAFTRGPVAFFMLDSDPHEPDGTNADSAQAQWLQDALKKSQAPWKLVIMHHPPFSSGRHGSSTWMQWPFKAWGADLVLAGHDHTYEHVVMDGLDHVVMGLSGARKDHFRVACALPHAEHDNCYDDNYGALEAEVHGDALTIKFTTIDGRVHDTLTLPRKR